MTRDEARSADCHHFSAASSAPDLNPADLTSVQHHAVTSAPSAKGPDPASRLNSHVCSHGLLQSHWEFSVHLFVIFGSCLKIERKYTKKQERCQQLFCPRPARSRPHRNGCRARGASVRLRLHAGSPRKHGSIAMSFEPGNLLSRCVARRREEKNLLDIGSEIFDDVRQIFQAAACRIFAGF